MRQTLSNTVFQDKKNFSRSLTLLYLNLSCPASQAFNNIRIQYCRSVVIADKIKTRMTQQLGVGVQKRNGLRLPCSVWLSLCIFTLTLKKREQYYSSITVRAEFPQRSVFFFFLLPLALLPLNASIIVPCDFYAFWKALYRQSLCLSGGHAKCLSHARSTWRKLTRVHKVHIALWIMYLWHKPQGLTGRV